MRSLALRLTISAGLHVWRPGSITRGAETGRHLALAAASTEFAKWMEALGAPFWACAPGGDADPAGRPCWSRTTDNVGEGRAAARGSGDR